MARDYGEKYGKGLREEIRRSMGLPKLSFDRQHLNKTTQRAISQGLENLLRVDVKLSEETTLKAVENIEMTELPGTANDVIQTTGDIETALMIIDDPPIDATWITQARRELAGLEKAMSG